MTQLSRSHALESVIGLVPLYLCPISALFSDAGSIGSALITFSAVLCGLVFLIKSQRFAEVVQLGWPFIALSSLYLVSMALNPSFTALKHALAVLSISLFFCFYIQNGPSIRKNPIFLVGALLAGVAFLIPSLLQLNTKNFDGGMALYGTCLITFLLLGNRPATSSIAKFTVVIFGLSTSAYGYLIDFRMLATYGALFIAVYLLITWHPKLMRLQGSAFLFLAATIGSVMFFYTNIESSTHLSSVNDFFIRVTDRPALSGRQILWPAIVSAISESPWLGMGAGVLPSDIINTDLSAHNYYLQVTLQVGLLGLSLAIGCTYCIWRRLFTIHSSSASSIFAATTLIIFLLHNASEVIMFQNALRVSIPAWLIFFIAASSNIREEKKKYK